MKFRMRLLIVVAVTVIVSCTYLTVIRPDIKDRSDDVDNDYIEMPDVRVDAWDFGPDPKWVKAVRASYNTSKSTISQNEGRPRARRLTVSERVNKYIDIYRPKWSYRVNGTSPWSIASRWVTSRQIGGIEATELGMNMSLHVAVSSVDDVMLLSSATVLRGHIPICVN